MIIFIINNESLVVYEKTVNNINTRLNVLMLWVSALLKSSNSEAARPWDIPHDPDRTAHPDKQSQRRSLRLPNGASPQNQTKLVSRNVYGIVFLTENQVWGKSAVLISKSMAYDIRRYWNPKIQCSRLEPCLGIESMAVVLNVHKFYTCVTMLKMIVYELF